MVRGIVIPAVNFLPLEEREFEGLQHYQDAVGGYIEPISIAEPPLTIYVNENGKSRKMSVNERATMLWWLFSPHVRSHDIIVGDAVVLAEAESPEGNPLPLLQREGPFFVEVQLAEAGRTWVAGPRTFDSWFEAARFALALTRRFTYVTDVRVTVE